MALLAALLRIVFFYFNFCIVVSDLCRSYALATLKSRSILISIASMLICWKAKKRNVVRAANLGTRNASSRDRVCVCECVLRASSFPF